MFDRKIHAPAFAATCALAMAATAPAAALEADRTQLYTPHIERVACGFTPPLGDSATCLMAWMPMSYEDLDADGTLPEGAARVGVHLTLLENFTSNPNPNPLVFLSGGPGQAGSDALGEMGNALELRRNRGLVLFDQRGTGLSVPRLDCPGLTAAEFDENRLNDPDLGQESDTARNVAACREKYVSQGIDLAAFDTRSAALDLRQIRKAVGLEQWNLMGTSYGTRVALDAMRVDPDGIRAVVLNSTLPTATQFDARHVAVRAEIFERMFADCAADEFCSAQREDLAADLRAIAAHLEAGPMLLQFRDPATGELTRQEVTWSDVIEALYGHTSFNFSSAAVPRYIGELAQVVQGRLTLGDEEVARIFQSVTGKIVEGMALGMHLSVKCREDFPFMNEEALAAALEANAFYHPDASPYSIYYEACPIWDVGVADAGFSAPVESDIPVLLLAGDVDPLTPMVWAQEAAETLPNAQLVSFRGIGHDVFDMVGCSRVITANFLDAPMEPVDAICAKNTQPRFEF